MGEDVLYGGDGNDVLAADEDGQRDKLYCGKGKDLYSADKIDYVDSSCEKINPSAEGAAARFPRTLVNSPFPRSTGRRCLLLPHHGGIANLEVTAAGRSLG